MTPFELSEALVEEVLALNPTVKTQLGIAGSDHLWGDLSPAGVRANVDVARKYHEKIIGHLDHEDAVQRHAAVVLDSYLKTWIQQFESGDYLYDISHVYCGFTTTRETFDIMDRNGPEAWRNIASRLSTIGAPLNGWRQLLQEGLDRGAIVARRQVESIIEQAEHAAGENSAFLDFLEEGRAAGADVETLETAVEVARREASQVADWLREKYLPQAVEADGVGRDRYVRAAEEFLGMVIDPEEVYRWGWEEIRRIQAEMVEVATEIDPNGTVQDVVSLLETDPSRAIATSAFTEFVRVRLEQAVRDLAGEHFAVPAPIRPITVNLAPPGGALGAWYHNPSVDWVRPGSVWYSFGDKDPIPLWQEVSTAYHEGFPGHHLQLGTSMFLAEQLSAAHRLFVWYSGYGEGWALYAERLMDELGYFEVPEYRFGMLATQLFRAVRVVVDVGSHLSFAIPDDAPLHRGSAWTFERAVDYISEVGLQSRDVAESEVKRYLGWPGQAISYKLGEREILDLRRLAEQRDGDSFDLKEFHRKILEGGEVRLDYLRTLMLG